MGSMLCSVWKKSIFKKIISEANMFLRLLNMDTLIVRLNIQENI